MPGGFFTPARVFEKVQTDLPRHLFPILVGTMGTYSGKVNASKGFRKQGDGNLNGNQVGTQTGTFLYDERNSIIHTYTRPFFLWPCLGLRLFSGSHLPTFAALPGFAGRAVLPSHSPVWPPGWKPGRVVVADLAHGPGRRMPGAVPVAGAGHMRTDAEMSAGAASLATLTGRG